MGATKGRKASFGRSGGGLENAAGEGSGFAYLQPTTQGRYPSQPKSSREARVSGEGTKEITFQFSSDIHKQYSSINLQNGHYARPTTRPILSMMCRAGTNHRSKTRQVSSRRRKSLWRAKIQVYGRIKRLMMSVISGRYAANRGVQEDVLILLFPISALLCLSR